MKDYSIRLTGSKRLYIFPVSDIHIGSSHFNEAYFNYFLDRFDEIESHKIMYLLGDIIECASLRVGNGAYKTVKTTDEQVDEIISYLKPYKKYIRKIVIGNHEARLLKDYDYNVLSHVGRALKTDVCFDFFDRILINDQELVVYGKHGKGSAQRDDLAEGKMIRENMHIEADIILSGHLHRCRFNSVPIRTHNGLKRKYYGLTGHFLKYDNSYAHQMTLPIIPESFLRLDINKNLHINPKFYHADQVLHEYQ